ncbi:MAG: hypothetical protein A3I66_02355 [Burkholderiales bacterium RIFCSPLOWO2_02_FULL_57_36]|nr:MAG: hypothetical protein A3I66_02355 [Burkholderiales bacterium RIFCSPLOWO2_02_FULL_57_36]
MKSLIDSWQFIFLCKVMISSAKRLRRLPGGFIDKYQINATWPVNLFLLNAGTLISIIVLISQA